MTKKSVIHDYHPGMYVACVYDKEWFLGVIVEVSIANEAVMIKFMNENMNRNSLSWPVRDDISWIPVSNILCRITTLSPQSGGGRVYSVSFEEYKCTTTCFHNIDASVFVCLQACL